jgi:tetratricopeptide (TPR) repeat protein
VVLLGAILPTALAQDRAPGTTPTFASDVAPIIFESCSGCHRPGESGPFDLLTYEDVRKRANQIMYVTQSGFMPPWLPEEGHGEFVGERRLTREQIATLASWAKGGTPLGDPAVIPALPEWTEGWQLGEPDLVIKMEEPYVLAAAGTEVFRNFVIPIPVGSRKYVRAVELRPGNPKVVHHAIMRTDETRSSRLQASLDPEPGFGDMNMGDAVQPDGYLLGWTPGNQPDPGADGFAWTLRPDTDFVLQLHLQPSGKLESVQSLVGFHFADEPPDRQIANIMLRARGIDIPAGESHHAMTDRYTIPVDVDLVSIYPHAHYLGKQFEGWAELPDGSKLSLIKIDDWDFNWQDEYRYAEPVRLPAGSTVFMDLVFDNSADNFRNPNSPPKRVVEGPRSVDEMGTLTLQVVPKNLEERAALRQALATQDVEKDPENWLHHDNLATLAHDAGRLDEAVGHYRETLRLNPTRTEALINLGSILLSEGSLPQAEELLRRALNLNPGSARAHLSYGRLVNATGDPATAERHYLRSIELQPRFAEAHGSLAQLYAAQGRLDDAARHYELGLAASPDSAELHNNLGNLRFMQQRPAEAERAYRRSLELLPRQAEAHNNLGNSLFFLGKLDDAIEHFRAALEIDPNLQDTGRNLQQALELRTERDAAVAQAVGRVESTGGRDPGALMMLADVYAGYGLVDEALETAARALHVAASNAPMAERIRRQMQRYKELLPQGGER